MLQEVQFSPQSLQPYRSLVGDSIIDTLKEKAKKFRDLVGDKNVWNINSTAKGGGVAEMLAALLGYGSDLDIKLRWLVIEGDAPFFEITKRIHNQIHGFEGDGCPLGPREQEHYQSVMAKNLNALKGAIQPGDFVILHDPQTAGLAKALKEWGARVIWRCHIGRDESNVFTEKAWDFLRPFILEAEAFIFTRKSYAPDFVPEDKVFVITPSIDPFHPKNREMSETQVASVIHHIGITQRPKNLKLAKPIYTNSVGESVEVIRYADKISAGPLAAYEDPMVVQVSRWDRLKDMLGVMSGFADFVADHNPYQLALVGPNVHGVTDDPEGAKTFEACLDYWRSLPHFRRNKILLVCLPMRDEFENAAMVNAIQRHAQVVVQKSLYEGFGLTITEAMWKQKPVVASRLGGIQDQIHDGEDGLLLGDPTDLRSFGELVNRCLKNPELRSAMGQRAHEKVKDQFLAPKHLLKFFSLVDQVYLS